MIRQIDEATAFLRSACSAQPCAGVILGSGLGDAASVVENPVVIPYADIPHAPLSAVVGHSGKLILGNIGALPVAIMQGRVHYYEGHSMERVLFLPRVLGRLGVRRALLTNAAGGVDVSYVPGDLMLITDHINLLGENPLRGANLDELGPRFPDLTEVYSKQLRERAAGQAERIGLAVREGVYMGLSGPTYETPAEIRAWRLLGADAVGMSTVPEAIGLTHMGVEILGISCITNMAAGVLPQKVHHDEVIETTTRIRDQFTGFVHAILEDWASDL